MTEQWVKDRLPEEADADPQGQVRWHPRMPGMLMHWTEVREGELWSHSSSWVDKTQTET